jgi:uncharacterized membrane protein
MLIAFGAIVLAIIATVRVARLERELGVLRKRLDAADAWLRSAAVAIPERPGHTVTTPSAPVAATITPGTATESRVSVPPPAADQPTATSERAAGRHSVPPPFTPLGPTRTGPLEWPTPSPVPPVAPPAAASDQGSLERRIGERLLLYAGMVLVVFAVGFFLRYAFEHDWVSPAVRVSLGLAGGLALVAGGARLVRGGYEQYGLFITGGGFAVLFLSIYAAFAIYALIGQTPAFALLVLVAAAAAAIADRHESLPLALMAVCGGFIAPFLVSTGSDAQVTLFTYDIILVAATMYLARRRGWPSLNLASFLFTVFTVTAWMLDRYTPDRYLSTELFLTAFCALFVAILRENLRSARPNVTVVSGVLALAPALYHLASLAILFEHGVAFLIYVTLVSAVLVVASLEARAAVLRFIGWFVVAVPLAAWVAMHQTPGWFVGSIVVAISVWLIFLSTGLRAAAGGEEVDAWDTRLVHTAGLTAFGTVYVAIEDRTTPLMQASVAALFAVANVGIWAVVRRASETSIHWLGVGASLAAVGVAIGFDGFWTVVMWSAEAAAVMWIGVKSDRFWFRIGGLALFAVAITVWLQITPPELRGPFVVVLNARALSGMFVIAMLYLIGWAQRAGDADARAPHERGLVLVAAHALTVVLMSMEITSFWEARAAGSSGADFTREVMLSSAWAIYAAALIAVGMRRHYAPIRYFAIALIGLTVLKVIAVDTQALDGIYRVLAFLVVGGILLGVSFLYQRVKGAFQE